MALCFISYARDDQAWAEWIGWQLQDAGQEMWLDVWELRTGDDWQAVTADALSRAELVLVLISASFPYSGHVREELAAASAAGATVIPVLVSGASLPAGLDDISKRSFLQLGTLDEPAARQALLSAVAPGRPQTLGRLRRFGATSPRLPGSRPRLWRVPERAARFVGRIELLKDLRSALTESSRVMLVGEPGAGKTQLAIEYAQRFAGEYELVWWIAPAGHAAMVQLADLAVRLGAAESDGPLGHKVTDLIAELRTRNRWLLIFDDVHEEADAAVADRLLRDTGTGQILLISSERQGAASWHTIEVGPLSSEESMALLRDLAPTVSAEGARSVAVGGDIPLAVGVVAGVINSGGSVAAYSRALPTDGPFAKPRHSLADTVRIGLSELSERNPRAVALLSACSLLAPLPFRLRDCVRVPDWTPEPLVQLLEDGRARAAALAAVNRLGLASTADSTVRVHAAVQSLLRDQLTPAERADAALGAQALLVSALPSLRTSPQTPGFLLPHLLTIAPQDLTRAEGLDAACEGGVRLLEDGDAPAAVTRLRELRNAATALLGADDPSTMEITSYLIDGLWKAGELDAALPLARIRLAWLRSTASAVKPVALNAAAQLTGLLVASENWDEALQLGMDTRGLLRATLGPDHPTQLELASTMLTPLRALGRTEEGLSLGEDVLARQRRTLGPDHVDTLRTGARLIALLVDHGALEQACDLGEEVFERLRTELGAVSSARFRAAVLWAVPLIRTGREETARDLLQQTRHQQWRMLGPEHIESLRTSALLTVLDLREHSDGALDTTALAAYARKADVPSQVRQRLLEEPPPLEFVTAHLFDEALRAAADILRPDPLGSSSQPSESRSPRRPASLPDRGAVLISHVEVDRIWADWIGFELERMGYEVRTTAEDTRLGRPPSQEFDHVVTLLSPDYLAVVAPSTDDSPKWDRLISGYGLDPHHVIPLFVRPVDPARLPRSFTDTATPALYDLDPDAARDVLQVALEEPTGPSGPPVFPGALDAEENDDALLTHRLVNALSRSAALQNRNSRGALWDLVGVPNRESVSPRTALFELVRTLRSRPDGLTDLVDALAVVEGDSLATTEVRNVVAEIKSVQEAR